MKIYLSGKITGNPDFERQFAGAEAYLKSENDTAVILNPAILPSGLCQSDYMRISLAMLDCADIVVMLPNWKESDGAKVEYAYAEKISKPIMHFNDAVLNYI